MVGRVFSILCFASGSLAIVASRGLGARYGLLLCGVLALWCGALVVWVGMRRRVAFVGRHGLKRLLRLVDLVFAILPGALLMMYGGLAPAVPSLTRGGLDVCDTFAGFCVSGTRAFVDLGICTLIVGVIANWVIGLENPGKSDSLD